MIESVDLIEDLGRFTSNRHLLDPHRVMKRFGYFTSTRDDSPTKSRPISQEQTLVPIRYAMTPVSLLSYVFPPRLPHLSRARNDPVKHQVSRTTSKSTHVNEAAPRAHLSSSTLFFCFDFRLGMKSLNGWHFLSSLTRTG